VAADRQSVAATIGARITPADGDQQFRLTRLHESIRGQFRKQAVFRADNRQEEQSTKGQRRTTAMRAIKCLLLLAAVLSFAAINADAMNNPPNNNQPINNQPINNQPINDPRFNAQQLAAFFANLNNLARLSHRDARNYIPQPGDDVETCSRFNGSDFVTCMNCCVVKSYRRQQAWSAKQTAFANFGGLCICIRFGNFIPNYDQYVRALRKIDGDVVDPPRANRNNQNQQ
jgi:hypothetical protein